MHKKAVLFDLDGTLLDTCEGVLLSVKETEAHFGLPALTDAEYQKFNGPPMKQSMMRYHGLDSETADTVTAYFRERYKTVNLRKAARYAGEIEALTALKARGVRMGVATYKRTDYAIDILKHFELAPFFAVIEGDTEASDRTKADIIRIAAEKLAADPREVVMVGDTMGDYDGATAAGADFIGVTYGFGFTPDGEKPDGVQYCNSFKELLKILCE